MYAYAYVQRGVVIAVERRTIGDTDPHTIGKYYHGSLQPFFIPIIPAENAPNDRDVVRGWVYKDGKFSEPEPFTVNTETGELYLPPSISADMFWQVYQDNIQLRNQLGKTEAVANQLLLDQLIAEGAVIT